MKKIIISTIVVIFFAVTAISTHLFSNLWHLAMDNSYFIPKESNIFTFNGFDHTTKVDTIEQKTDENDFSIINKILKESPAQLESPNVLKRSDSGGIEKIQYHLLNYMEYEEPYRFFYPYWDSIHNTIEFIVTFCPSGGDISTKISFKNGQYFLFGKNYKLITEQPTQVINKSDSNSLLNPNYLNTFNYILKTKSEKYLVFIVDGNHGYIHHLFDITDESNIKYFLLFGIATMEEGYFIDKAGKVKFKQMVSKK